MGDVGDYWKDVREHRRNLKSERTEILLKDVHMLSLVQGMEVTHHTEFHLTLSLHGRAVDFYPTTGKWSGRKPARTGHGIKSVAGYLGLKWDEVCLAAELEREQLRGVEDEA